MGWTPLRSPAELCPVGITEGMAGHPWESRPSPDTECTGTLILDFCSLQNCEKSISIVYKLFHLWDFVTALQGQGRIAQSPRNPPGEWGASQHVCFSVISLTLWLFSSHIKTAVSRMVHEFTGYPKFQHSRDTPKSPSLGEMGTWHSLDAK